VTRFRPAGPLRGSLRPPSDKSISHRAALIAAMGEGETLIDGYLDAADTRSTLAAVEAVGGEVVLGEEATTVAPPDWSRPRPPIRAAPSLGVNIRGVGLRGAGPATVDVGNAGTLLRLLPGWLAGQVEEEWTLDGDDSIRRRPVDRIAIPLREMGARLTAREDRLPPLIVEGAPLHGIEYRLPVASAQVKSCILFAGLLAEGETRVIEPEPTRDHTERMLKAAGASIEVTDTPGASGQTDAPAGRLITVRPAERLEPGPIRIPADISSAAFFLTAAVLVPGSELEFAEVGVNPTRIGLLTILERMGAEIERDLEVESGGERVATLRVRSASLQATEVGGAEVPLAIDELPLVALAACFAEGRTTISDAAELRRKESDRIATVTAALVALGGRVEATEDGMVIEGTGGLRGGAIDAHGDHRIAMLGAVAGLASREGVEVAGMEAAAVSYPGFEADLASLFVSGR
jgi:3-phosphoshikimate 1-carboxyvinyltransferase